MTGIVAVELPVENAIAIASRVLAIKRVGCTHDESLIRPR